MTQPVWPSTWLKPRKITVEPAYGNMGGGRSISGIDQIIASDAGYWEIIFDEIPFAHPSAKLAARAFSGLANGRLNPVVVPTFDGWTATPAQFNGQTLSYTSNGGISLAQSTLVSINKVTGGPILAGMHFSAVGSVNTRLYRVLAVTGSGPYSCTIWPPCREAVTGGGTLNFQTPSLTVRLKTDTEMQSFIDDYAGRTLAKVTFEEALP